MNNLTIFIDGIAKHGNCFVFMITPNKNQNYVIEVSNDPFHLFKVSLQTFDGKFWDGENINQEVKLIDEEVIVSDYSQNTMHSILSFLIDNTLIGKGQGVICAYHKTNNPNLELANELIETSIDALDMTEYEIFELLQNDYNERIDMYCDNMIAYENDRYETYRNNARNRKVMYEKAGKKVSLFEIEEDITFINDIVDYTQERILQLSELIDELANAKEDAEESFFVKKIDKFCGGLNRIVKNNDDGKVKVVN